MLFLETTEEIDRPPLVLKVDPPEESSKDITENSSNSNSAISSDRGIYAYKYSKILRYFTYLH